MQHEQQGQAQVSTGAVLGKGSFEFGGTVYAVGPVTLDVEVAFEDYLKLEAAREVNYLITARRSDGRPALDPVAAEAMLYGLRGDLASHRWAYEGPDAFNARHTPAGARQLLLYRLQAANTGPQAPRVTQALVHAVWRDRAKWDELAAVCRGIDDPNPSAPERPGADS